MQVNITVKYLVIIARENTTLLSVIDKRREHGMIALHVGKSTVIHPAVVVKVAGYKFRALLDSRASHSYGSSTFLNLTKPELKSSGVHHIAMLMGVTSQIM